MTNSRSEPHPEPWLEVENMKIKAWLEEIKKQEQQVSNQQAQTQNQTHQTQQSKPTSQAHNPQWEDYYQPKKGRGRH